MSRLALAPLTIVLGLGLVRCDSSGSHPGGPLDGGGGGPSRDARPGDGAADATAGTNCDNNPAGCQDGQARGAPPSCTCLPGCMPGFVSDGTRCVRADGGPGSTDTGSESDSGTQPSPDAGALDSGGSADASRDAAVSDAAPNDGAPGDGAPSDAGLADSALDAAPDAALDGAVSDATPADATPTDATPTDAGFPDAAADAGSQDAATDGGVLNPEGAACTPAQNNCQAGMTCFDTGGGSGVCLRTCDTTHNLAGTYANAACTGIGQDCVDRFNLGPTNGRCLNVLGEYVEFRPGAPPLAACDPAFANLFEIQSNLVTGGGACMPLCTVRTSTTQPVNLACSGTFTSCDPSTTIQDTAGNIYGFCTIPVARGQVCGFERGRSCASGDLCAGNLCHQAFGATCTATTTCQNTAETCRAVTSGAASFAFCEARCQPLQATSCGPGLACALAQDPGSTTIYGVCRALTGQLAQGAACSDVFAVGTHWSDCSQGQECEPVAPATDLTSAQCETFCDPAASACPANTTCHAFPAPNSNLGLCF